MTASSSNAQRVRQEDFFSSQPTGQLSPPPTNLYGAPSQVSYQPPVLPQLGTPQLGPPPAIYQGGTGNIAPPQAYPPIVPNDPSLIPSQPFPSFTQSPNPGTVFPDPRAAPPNPWAGSQPGTVIQDPNFAAFQQPNPNGTWPYQGTSSNGLPPIDWGWPQEAWSDLQGQFLPRLVERPRARQTWIAGGDEPNSVSINELEFATTINLPKFMGTTQPLRVSPGFVFLWLNGPDSTVLPDYDLPPRVYSSYISMDHMTDPNNKFGLENNLTIGYYSDFDNTSSDAIRLTGKLVGWTRFNPYTVGKFGVEYLDRVHVKVLPAFGVYMAPNSDVRWDLYFPRTKLAHRMPNCYNYEVWSYLGAEYGGGSWAIDRRNGASDQVDINDVRSFVGVEWMGPKRVTGFLELGYLFNRELVYRSDPDNPLSVGDAFMLRSGLAF